MSNLNNKKQDIAEVITHDVTPLTVNTDAGAYAKVGWAIVLFGVGAFFLWALFAPLDKGVPVPGFLAKEGSRKAIQYQSIGTVQDILVKDGDVVKAGQLLVRMNNVQAKSQADVSHAQYIAARATEARLIAERDGLKAVAFPAALKSYGNDPRVQLAVSLQNELFFSRQAALHNEIGASEESMAGIKMQAKGLALSLDAKKEQLAIVKEQLANMNDLAKDGYVARSRMQDVQRTYFQLNGEIAEDIGNIGRSERQVSELTLRIAQRNSEYQKEVRSQLSDIQREAESLSGRLAGQDFDVSNTEVKAPVDGIVVGLSVFTRGGVVSPGAHLMDLVPTDDALIVEGQLPVNLIDKVHSGLPVQMIFSAFNASKTPRLPGTITVVSADRAVDEKTGQGYYKIRARVTPEGMKLIAEHKLELQSGMPVEMLVQTGQRTMMNYLMKPIFDRMKTSMVEE